MVDMIEVKEIRKAYLDAINWFKDDIIKINERYNTVPDIRSELNQTLLIGEGGLIRRIICITLEGIFLEDQHSTEEEKEE